jgi:hypothetical protein
VAELADLAAQARENQSVRAPVVTAYLAQGAAIHGALVDAVHGPGGPHLCLARAVDHHTRDLAFFPAGAITALIVHDVDRLAAPPADAPEPPSRLALLRAVADARARLLAATGASIEIQLEGIDDPGGDSSARAALGEALPSVLDVLTVIAQDELGRTALPAKLAAVHIRAGDQGGVALDGKTLTVTVARARRHRQGPDALRAALEKLL